MKPSQDVENLKNQASQNLPEYWPWLPVGILVAARLWTVMALSLDGLRGYGDFLHFFQMAKLPGWPFLQSWSEFPPVFPFLAELIFRMANGQEHVFVYLLYLVLLAADAGSLYVFIKISSRLENRPAQMIAVAVYLVILCSLPYSWWYFDPLVVFFTLLSLYLWLEKKNYLSGLALAAGILTKFFPVLLFAPMVRNGERRQIVKIGIVILGVCTAIYGALWLSSPAMTGASLASQAKKGSWETVWALLDGNLQTGNFGPEIERLDPATAFLPRGNPARIPAALTLIAFSGLGVWALFSVRVDTFQKMIWMTGLVFCLFFLWSPGWSPQWVLYLVPLILLGSPPKEGVLMAFVLILINLLEWPVLLSRGYFWGLWLTIPLRTMLILVLGLNWFVKLRQSRQPEPAVEAVIYP
jgi:hypothetical protein